MTVVEESGLSIIIEDPGSKPAVNPDQSSFRPRRCHTKSRNGCVACKRRRIKCDEARPECSYCWEKGMRCHYPSRNGVSSITKKAFDSANSFSINDDINLPKAVEKEALLVLERHRIPCDRVDCEVNDVVYKQSDALDLLRHFLGRTNIPWIASPECQRIMEGNCLRLAWDAPYYLHAVLAYSATFLSFVYPESRKYRIAKTLHYQRALEQFFEHLDTDFRDSDADAMMASAILLSMLCFVHTTALDPQDRTSNAPYWVRTMQGTQIMFQTPVLLPGLSKGIFAAHIDDFAKWKSQIFDHRPKLSLENTEDVEQVQRLGNLCSTAPLEHRDLYRTPIFLLGDLAQLQPDLVTGRRFIYFMATLPNEFLDLLNAEDPLAMLIIAFWCAYLSRLELWWIVQSASNECLRICRFIDGLDDARFDSLTRYLVRICPATAKEMDAKG